MIWSLLKVAIFLVLAAALAFGVNYMLDTPGGVQLIFGDKELTLSPFEFAVAFLLVLIAAYILLKLAGLLIACIRFLRGDETAFSRYTDRRITRKGVKALSEGVIALSTGDAATATRKVERAERYLNRIPLTKLLSAQAAEKSGNKVEALALYKELLEDEDTRFIGIRGIMQQKLDEGDTDTALKLAEKAFALKPKNSGIIDQLFDLQSTQKDWAGARKTLGAKIKTRALPRDVGRRRDAVLSIADARAASAAGEGDRARDAAYQANRLAPGLVPAATLASELHQKDGSDRTASRVLRKAWEINPHPDIAAAFAALEPNETPAARIRRFSTLTNSKPDHPESKLLLAELHLANEDFPAARKAIGDLAESHATSRTLAIMAAIEKGQGESEEVIRAWLAKALDAPRGEQWTCSNCRQVQTSWAPVCDNCGAFDSLAWVTPPQDKDSATSSSALLPLIVGSLQSSDKPEATNESEAQETSTGTPSKEEVIEEVAKPA